MYMIMHGIVISQTYSFEYHSHTNPRIDILTYNMELFMFMNTELNNIVNFIKN